MPKDHALKLMAENVTLPPLNMATVAPMSNANPFCFQLWLGRDYNIISGNGRNYWRRPVLL